MVKDSRFHHRYLAAVEGNHRISKRILAFCRSQSVPNLFNHPLFAFLIWPDPSIYQLSVNQPLTYLRLGSIGCPLSAICLHCTIIYDYIYHYREILVPPDMASSHPIYPPLSPHPYKPVESGKTRTMPSAAPAFVSKHNTAEVLSLCRPAHYLVVLHTTQRTRRLRADGLHE